jgi:hypothetical protein
MPEQVNAIDRRTRYEELRAALWSERMSGFDSHWRDLADNFMPRRVRWTVEDRNKGDRRNQDIIDSTGRFSARTLASGLHSGLTSPARPWLKLTTPNQDLAEFGPVKRWLHTVTQRMLVLFATTNLYNVLPLVYLDMGIFGTAAMAIVGDVRDLFRCYSYPIGSYALGLDHRNVVGTFTREYELTVRQVVESFGVQPNGRDIKWDRISRTVRDLWDRSSYEVAVPVCWMVKPNDLRYERASGPRPAKFLPYASCHWEYGSSEPVFLRESGFKNNPIMAPRWDVTGEDSYGTDSPGMTALGDTQQLQSMQLEKAKAIAKQVDPPVVAPSQIRGHKTSLLAGDITYVDLREGMQGMRSVYDVNLNLRDLTADIREVQYRIQRAFYEDLFLMLARSDEVRGTQPPTAREIDERHEEKLLALGPVLERTNDELLDPIVDRVYNMMDEAGLFPPPPPELEGVVLKVEYISILAQAQKLVGVVGQDRFLQSAAMLAEQFPEVKFKIDTNRVINNYADMLGVDPSIVRSDEDADAMREQAAQAVQQQAESEQMVNAAKAAKDASQAPLTGDSVLNRLVSGTNQPGAIAAPPTG